MSNQKYQKYTHQEHVLKLPDTYIGSTEKTTDEIWYFDASTKSMKKGPVTFVPENLKFLMKLH